MEIEKSNSTEPCEVRCQKCHEIAATIYFEPSEKLSIKVDGFLGTSSANQVGSRDVTKDLFEWIVSAIMMNPEALHDLDPDLFGFICRVCKKTYCKNCWQDVHAEFDPDWPVWFEEFRGTCPEGHSQMLED